MNFKSIPIKAFSNDSINSSSAPTSYLSKRLNFLKSIEKDSLF